METSTVTSEMLDKICERVAERLYETIAPYFISALNEPVKKPTFETVTELPDGKIERAYSGPLP